MDILVYVTLGLGVLATIFFLVVRVKFGGIKGTLAKTLASVFFVLTAVFSSIANQLLVSYEFATLIILGLVLGLIGDILLDLKVTYPQDGDTYLFCGMCSFALGHIAYVTAIYLELAKSVSFTKDWMVLGIPMIIAAVFAVVAVFILPLFKSKAGETKYGKFTAPSFIYGFLLGFMMCATCAGLIVTRGQSPLWIEMFIGAVMFVASDLILSQQYFLQVTKTLEDGTVEIVKPKANDKFLIVINHATYYIAQFLIAISIFVIGKMM